MLEFARWKYVLAVLIFLFGILYSLPNLYPQDTALQITGTRGKAVDDALVSRVSAILDRGGIAYKAAQLEQGNLLVRLVEPSAQIRAADLVRETLRSDYIVALNLASTVPAWLEAIGAFPMVLGLDLQGGVHFVMEVDQKAAIEKRQNGFADDIRALLRDNKVGYSLVERRADGVVEVQLRNPADRNQVARLIGRELPDLALEDAVSSVALLAHISDAKIKAVTDDALEQNLATLRTRINSLGVAEPVVQRQGTSRIVVQLPGVQDTALAKKILGATATLEWRAVMGSGFTDALDAARSGRVPADARLYYQRPRDGGEPQPVLLSKRVIASGDQLVETNAGFDPEGGLPMVSVQLDNVGGKRMLDHTTDNVGKQMGVVFIERTPEVRMVDGKQVRTVKVTEEVISVATTQGVFGKRFQITGLESAQYASELALLMRAGSLAAPVDIVSERIIGPSLGKENIERGWRAVAYSFLFVLIFFLVYYRMFGLITNIALLVNMLLVIAVMSLIGATLTLPGLAGIALTVALSVDANVLINERIREELLAGNTPMASIATGYDKASGTIFDANVTALLAGIALFSFGTGPVKGFAVSMCLGILTSMYAAVSVSRGIATLIYGRRRRLQSVSI